MKQMTLTKEIFDNEILDKPAIDYGLFAEYLNVWSVL